MALKNFAFKVLNKDNFARCGLIETYRGNIRTPAFMPVGTQATVKACRIERYKKNRFRYNIIQHLSFNDQTRCRTHPKRRRSSSIYEL
jgi:hypothetical protein